jgi:hypothetical protein
MAGMYVAYLSEWAPGPNAFAHVRSQRPATAYLAIAVASFAITIAGPRM